LVFFFPLGFLEDLFIVAVGGDCFKMYNKADFDFFVFFLSIDCLGKADLDGILSWFRILDCSSCRDFMFCSKFQFDIMGSFYFGCERADALNKRYYVR
jgi:hypothetical protein